MDSLDRHLAMRGKPKASRGKNRGPARLDELGHLVGAQIIDHEGLRCLVREVSFSMSHVHGDLELGTALTADYEPVEAFACGPGRFDPSRVAYMDLETTGLRNAMAFLVGLGFFRDGHFVLQQFFVPAPPDEDGMLVLLNESMRDLSGLVTFNGRSFDWPLLCDRYVRFARQPLLNPLPHLDLLLLARRFWKRMLSSCSLGSVEQNRLGVVREGHDIPGYLVPEIYDDYLHLGEIDPLEGVFYHNEIDILSLVTLTARTQRLLSLYEPYVDQEPAECLALARMFESQAFDRLSDSCADSASSWFERAMAMYQGAIRVGSPVVAGEGSERLGLMLKRWARNSQDAERVNRYGMAMDIWRGQLNEGLVEPFVELAKVYEHQPEYRNLAKARDLTVQAIRLVRGWRPITSSQREILHALQHRLRRLETKMAIGQSEST